MEEKDLEVTATEETKTEENVEEEVAKDETESTEEELEEVEEDDSEETSEEEKKEVKSKQSKEENSKYAEMRRAKEAKEKEEELRRKYVNEGIKNALGNKNPYTGKEIKTDRDIETYKIMKEMENRGLDPTDVGTYVEFTNVTLPQEQEEKEKQEKASEISQQERMNKDMEEFRATYKDVDMKELFQNENFKSFALNSVGIEPLTSVYERYINFQKKIESTIKEKVNKALAKKIASPGSLISDNETSSNKKSFNDMSDEEFKKWKKEHNY